MMGRALHRQPADIALEVGYRSLTLLKKRITDADFDEQIVSKLQAKIDRSLYEAQRRAIETMTLAQANQAVDHMMQIRGIDDGGAAIFRGHLRMPTEFELLAKANPDARILDLFDSDLPFEITKITTHDERGFVRNRDHAALQDESLKTLTRARRHQSA